MHITSNQVRFQVFTAASMKMAIFWDVAPSTLAKTGQRLPWWWKQYAYLKRWSISTWLYGATSQKTVIFILLLAVEWTWWNKLLFETRLTRVEMCIRLQFRVSKCVPLQYCTISSPRFHLLHVHTQHWRSYGTNIKLHEWTNFFPCISLNTEQHNIEICFKYSFNLNYTYTSCHVR
jgi:hypothetical protein